jgi:murein DD-endopeptidase MepM/ murein hydrolase activator NlpD
MRRRHRAILLAALVLAFAPVTATSVLRAAGKTHVVAKGHSLWKIARRYNVTVDALREKNGLRKGDPIRPGQVLEIPGPKEKTRKGESKPVRHWVLEKPSASTQTQKSPKQRGGINPCLSPDPGFGVYDRWSRAPSIGQMISPQRGGITRSGRFDVMFHFHGHEAARKEWVRVMDGAVLVGIDLGIGSGPYSAAFRAPDAFKRLVRSVEAAMAEKYGKKRARARKIGISSWSAGYGAVGEIINQVYGRSVVDLVILLDGLHSGYGPETLTEAPLEPFVRFARAARARQKLMFVSHSSIIPPGYASTTETANYLIYKLGGRPRKARPRAGDPWGLELISRYSRGNFHVRGFRGNDRMDHCAHFGLYRDVLKVHVRPRWRSPRGYKKRS